MMWFADYFGRAFSSVIYDFFHWKFSEFLRQDDKYVIEERRTWCWRMMDMIRERKNMMLKLLELLLWLNLFCICFGSLLLKLLWVFFLNFFRNDEADDESRSHPIPFPFCFFVFKLEYTHVAFPFKFNQKYSKWRPPHSGEWPCGLWPGQNRRKPMSCKRGQS